MDPDTLANVIDLLGQQHEFGEAIARKIEMWISVSFAVIAVAYIAPDRLNPWLAVLMIAIYVAFTQHTFCIAGDDARLALAALADAARIAKEADINLALIQIRLDDSQQRDSLSSNLFIFGLGFGTMGFVAYTAYRNHVRHKTTQAQED